MFGFEKLRVYQKAKSFHKESTKLLHDHPDFDRAIRNQLSRASLSIPLNIAEGAGAFTDKSYRNYCVIARASAYECAAIFDILSDQGKISTTEFSHLMNSLDEVSRMLFSMIKKLEGQRKV